MRARFDIQLSIGQTPIHEIYINPKSKNALDQLIAALKEIYCNKEYNDEIFKTIEGHLPDVDRGTGRPGMNLWTVFVLGQVRKCLGTSYYIENKQQGTPTVLKYFDKLGRNIKIEETSFNEKKSIAETVFNNIGQEIKTSLPYFEGETPKWITKNYDNFDRLTSVNNLGKIIR